MAKFFININGNLHEIGDGKSAYELAVYNGYTGTEQEWIKSLHGKDGSTVTLDMSTKHWFLDGVDTGVVAEGITPSIDPTSKHWMLGTVDTGIIAEGKDGVTPKINSSTKEWIVDGVNTGINAEGKTPYIDSSTKHWKIGDTDTGVVAEAKDGVTPSIDSTNKHWFIGSTDTGIVAEAKDGVDGSTPTIDVSTKHWFIDGKDTNVKAEGKDGIDGKDGKSISSITKDDNNNIIVTFTDGTTQNIGQLNIDVQADFLTSGGFGNLRYYNGHFQYYNESSADWVDIESTVENRVITCMTPNSMKNFVAKYNMVLDRNVLLIEEPEDTIIDGQVLCFVEKVIIRRKINEAPINEEDGDLVTTILRKDFGSYSYNEYVDNDVDPSEGEKWYYRAFPVNTLGIINNLEDNNITYTPAPVKLDACTNLNISAQDKKVVITWEDPEETKTEEGQTATWESTILVYKEGTTAPTSLTDGIVAVEEKTLNQYSTSGFELAVDNGKDYSFSLFAITTDGAISEKISSTACMYATLNLSAEETSLFNKDITISGDSGTITGNFDSSGNASFKISWIGEISISCSDGNDTVNVTLQITNFNVNINKTLSLVTIVTFADGTDEEILAMIQAHYDDKINLSDYWAVGDTRTVYLSAMDATGVGESHAEQDVQFVIADFDHDELTNTINRHTTAAVTLSQKNSLNEIGYMNSSNTNSGGWEGCARRSWCNNVYYNALPDIIKNGIKQVNKKNYKVYNNATITTTSDYCFLLSETEIFGTNTYSVGSTEGTQYEYYKTSSNRIKQLNGSNSYWLQRSPTSGYSACFCGVGADGGANYGGASGANGLAPCLCI